MRTCAAWKRGWLEDSLAAELESTAPINVNGPRLLERLRELAQLGARAEGGVNRQAFSANDIAARHLMLRWADEIGLSPFTDTAGNLFLRLSSPEIDAQPAIISGSHLDTQPAGGWLDGSYGVLAAVEALSVIRESGRPLKYPLEAVAWVNEEGCRFHPGLMGSTAFLGDSGLVDLADQADDAGVRLADAHSAFMASTPQVTIRENRPLLEAAIEIHIEQGPILEAESRTIGSVTGVPRSVLDAGSGRRNRGSCRHCATRRSA